MTNNRNVIIAVILSLLVVGVIVYKVTQEKTNEEFGMLPSMNWRRERIVANTPHEARDGHFYSPVHYQSKLSPRMNSDGYSAVHNRLPNQKHLGVPKDPLSYANMAREDYKHGYDGIAQRAKVNNLGQQLPSHGKERYIPEDILEENGNDDLPVGDMTTINDLGEKVQSVTYDRMLFANKASRLRNQSDFIRGDLPIQPVKTGWFDTSAHPHVDLNTGAMNVMGGFDNQNAQKLSRLMFDVTDGTDVISGGVNVMDEFESELDNNFQDLSVTAFA